SGGAACAVAVGLTACAPPPPRFDHRVPVGTTSGPAVTAAKTEPVPTPTVPTMRLVPLVPLVSSYIPFGEARKQETAAYSLRHYGDETWRLTPTMVVLHYTAGESWLGARDTFAADLRDLGELPGTCAHYLVDRDGTVHALVPVTIRCRHTIGLNDRAIGVEVVQPGRDDPEQADREILARAPQREALLALVRQLMAQHHIPATSVIGHAMANRDPHFHDLRGWRNDHVDWQQPDVIAFRALL
ncbi:MAG: N-acetylmuramoyl-L-alanine amidase, partial [Actinomycetota bacterium]|nr:N-acetylmuramoyl-L-alanine amidase [Actinomycetota bacterium]